MPSPSIPVELLTRHRNVKSEIVDSVILKNQDHQLDADSILIDRQGILARFTDEKEKRNSSQRKFESAHCMFELAIAISRIIADDEFVELPSVQQAAVRDLIKKPSLVFTNSVTARKAWGLLIEEFQLDSLYERYVDQALQEPVVPPKPEWSDGRKWFMGIVSALIVSIVGGIGAYVVKLVFF